MYISWQYQSGEAGNALNRQSHALWKTVGSASPGPIPAYHFACLLQIDYLHIDEKNKTFRAPTMDIWYECKVVMGQSRNFGIDTAVRLGYALCIQFDCY